jgi:hypothetical protein
MSSFGVIMTLVALCIIFGAIIDLINWLRNKF